MYKRVANIDEIIQDVKLTYDAWKTLFLLSEETSLEEIAATLQEDPENIQSHLDELQKSGLIEKESPAEVPVEPQEELPVMEEEAISEEPSLEPEAEPVEEPKPIQESDVVEEPEAIQESDTVEEPEAVMVDETPIEEEMVLEDMETEELTEVTEEPEEPEVVIEDEAIADLLEEVDESPVDIIEEEAPVIDEADEEVESLITDETVEETESLDLNIEETVTEEESAPVDEIPQLEEQEQDTAGKNVILVIDDSIVIRKMVEIALENEDLIVETAVSGKDGMDKIDHINPSLIILDLMLPDINGIDILKTVKASRKIPVIMLSGKDSPQMVENAKTAGADAFLPKPFKDDELKEQIKTLLEA